MNTHHYVTLDNIHHILLMLYHITVYVISNVSTYLCLSHGKSIIVQTKDQGEQENLRV